MTIAIFHPPIHPLSTSAQKKRLLAAPDCSISGQNVYNKLPQCNIAHSNQYVDTWTDLYITEEGRVGRNVFVKGNKHFNICVFLLYLYQWCQTLFKPSLSYRVTFYSWFCFNVYVIWHLACNKLSKLQLSLTPLKGRQTKAKIIKKSVILF